MQMDMMTNESRTDPRTMIPIVKTLLESIFDDGELIFGTSGGAISSDNVIKNVSFSKQS
jgi:hypothetical protein